MDLLGIKRGFALALTVWSLAAMAAAPSRFGPAGGGAARHVGSPIRPRSPGYRRALVLGLGESGNSRRDQDRAEWFPQRERAFAHGLPKRATKSRGRSA